MRSLSMHDKLNSVVPNTGVDNTGNLFTVRPTLYTCDVIMASKNQTHIIANGN